MNESYPSPPPTPRAGFSDIPSGSIQKGKNKNGSQLKDFEQIIFIIALKYLKGEGCERGSVI